MATEETPDDATHEQDGDEYGDERGGHREDGEADLFGASHRGVEGTHALFEVAGDVLDDDDGVVDDEAGGDGERHEGEIVQRVAEQVHHAEGAEKRERHGDRGDERRAAFAEEEEDNEDDEQDGDDKRARDVVDRGADGSGAIEDDLDLDGRRDGGLKLRKDTQDVVDSLDDVGAG
jgi:hypothetical protein